MLSTIEAIFGILGISGVGILKHMLGNEKKEKEFEIGERRKEHLERRKERREKLKCFLHDLETLRGMGKDVKHALNKKHTQHTLAKRISEYMVDLCVHLSSSNSSILSIADVKTLKNRSILLKNEIISMQKKGEGSHFAIKSNLDKILILSTECASTIKSQL